MGQQDAHILDRCDQVVLDLPAPEPPPAGAFEVVVIGSIGKTRFHQVLTPFAITACGEALSLRARYI